MNNNIYNNEDEYKKEQEKERRRAVKEMKKLDREIRNDSIKSFIKIVFIIGIIIGAFKVFVGEINISLPNFLSAKDNRMYTIKINNQTISVSIEEYRKITVLPKMLYFNSQSNETYTIGDQSTISTYSNGETIKLSLAASNCFSITNEEYQLGCTNQNKSTCVKKPPKEKTKYTLTITKGKEIIYNGKYINNIEEYLENDGKYYIVIKATYKNITNNIYFWINIE